MGCRLGVVGGRQVPGSVPSTGPRTRGAAVRAGPDPGAARRPRDPARQHRGGGVMPHIDDEVLIPAPLEEVWKLVHDPTRYPEWWTGIGRVGETADDGHTMYPEGWPDYPMPQRLNSSSAHGRVTISCLVSDLEYRWQLTA